MQKTTLNPFKEKALETTNFQSELFNINYENLQEFLEKMVNVINTHAKTIGVLEDQLKTKVMLPQLEESLLKISESIKFPDQELFKSALTQNPDKPHPELTGNPIEESTNRICNKLSLLTSGLTLTYKKNKDFEAKIQKLEVDFSKKITREEMKTKVKKAKKKLNDAMEDQKVKLTRKLDDLDKKVAGSMAHLEVVVKDVEKKTIWKIQDCETLLQKRINNEYVENSCKALEDRLRKEMKMLSEGNFSNVNKSIADLKDKQGILENGTSEKYKNLKKQIIDLEDSLGLKVLSLDKFDEFKRGIFDKLNESYKQIKDLEKRGDPFILFKTLDDGIITLKDQVNTLDKKNTISELDIKDLRISLALLAEKGVSDGKPGEKSPFGIFDPHKLCALDSEQKKMKEDLHEYKHMVREFEKDVKKRLEQLDSKLITAISQLKQDDNKFSLLKEELLSYFDKTNQNLLEKMKNQAKDIEDLNKKILPFSEMDKKLRKLSQKLDFDQIFKQLQNKVETNELNKELLILDERLKNMNDLFNQMRKEFEKVDEFYNEFAVLMRSNPQETITTFIGNNSVTKARCLCCGIKGKNMNYSLYGQNHIHGTDGKVYRADLKPANLYEGQEVYDLSSNQIENILNKSANLEASKSFSQPAPNYNNIERPIKSLVQNTILPSVLEKTPTAEEKSKAIKRKDSKKLSKTGKNLRPDSAKK